jgi:hypothetical protein
MRALTLQPRPMQAVGEYAQDLQCFRTPGVRQTLQERQSASPLFAFFSGRATQLSSGPPFFERL